MKAVIKIKNSSGMKRPNIYYIGKEIDALSNAKSATYYRLDEDKRHITSHRVRKRENSIGISLIRRVHTPVIERERQCG